MPLQDLTPELRTRLHRAERTVRLVVTLAAVILLAGFAYYIYAHRAGPAGLSPNSITPAIVLDSAAGLSAGDPITLIGI